MYKYEWDPETGGFLLTTEQMPFSREPRPVYYRELDILGFDQFWDYPKDDSAPIMWAEANNYVYRGDIIAKTEGGGLYTRPKLILMKNSVLENTPLQFVDVEAMCRKNADMMKTIAYKTSQRIYNTYFDHLDKVNIFYVAFSGGKDSVVVLDLAQKSLPSNSFSVLFGDTRMELSDTYRLIEKVKRDCEAKKIQFLTSQSEQLPEYTWNEFGPPAQKLRWCCSVHKTSPQVLLLRKLTSNLAFCGMAFTGIRWEESTSRSQYDFVSFGEKHKGQYSCHAILDWNSAEVFLYIYSNHLELNETYKTGNSRAGCLVCPMATSKNFFFKEHFYGASAAGETLKTTKYNDIILKTTSKVFSSPADQREFMDTCGWKARRSGKELNFASDYCLEVTEKKQVTITLLRERTDWKEWIKTLGNVIDITEQAITIEYESRKYVVLRENSGNKQKFIFKGDPKAQENVFFLSALKTVLRKSAYCVACHVCEVNCPFGFITMSAGHVKISDKCVKCRKCHEVSHGCLVADSLRLQKGVSKMGSIDRYANLGVEYSWVLDYFAKKDGFWSDNILGPNMVKSLKAFLCDAEVIAPKTNTFTAFGGVIDTIGITNAAAWGLLTVNLAYTSEFHWWITETEVDRRYTKAELLEMLKDDVPSNNSRTHVVDAYKNIFASNRILSDAIRLGRCELKPNSKNRVLLSIWRESWDNPIPEVILYSLYKFAEACSTEEDPHSHYQFSLSTLLDDTIDRDGVSPTRIFGLDREIMTRILNALSINYPNFINAAFTLDKDTIELREDKTSADVLTLF